MNQNHDWVTAERLSGLPPVVFLAMEPRPGVSIVSTDNRKAAELATRHLIDNGRRKIGIVTGPLHWWEAQERMLGWRETLSATGAPHDDALMIEGDWSASGGERALDPLLARHRELDGIYASNDRTIARNVRRNDDQLAPATWPGHIRVSGFEGIPERGASSE